MSYKLAGVIWNNDGTMAIEKPTSLEALKRLRKGKASNSDITLIKRALKALEIIKEKEIDVALFKECPNIDEYNNWCSDKSKLTQEEYDLLRKVLL